MRLLSRGPSAKHFVNRKQIQFRELFLDLCRDLRIDGSIVMPGSNLLSLGRLEILQISRRDVPVAFAIDDPIDKRHRGLGQNADRWHHNLELLGPQFLSR